MWTVHGPTYLEVKNVLAQNKMAVWDFLKKWEYARKQMLWFQKTEVTQVLSCGMSCDINYMSMGWPTS